MTIAKITPAAGARPAGRAAAGGQRSDCRGRIRSSGPVMTPTASLLAGSRAVLIGVSAYEYAEFPPIRAARNSLQAMRSLLADPALCGWPPEQVTVIPNPISAADLATNIADLAENTAGVLLLYYVGHGVLSARGELCLTVTSTRPDRPKISGLPWDTVADVLRGCPASRRLAILDCCFAGQAIEALTGGGDHGLADIAHVEGVYTLTATTRNRAAHVPPPGQQDTACTSFTGELQDLIRGGLPGKAPRLTFGDIYPALRQRLRGKGLPAPGQRGTDAVGQFAFAANAAVPAGQSAGDPAADSPAGQLPADLPDSGDGGLAAEQAHGGAEPGTTAPAAGDSPVAAAGPVAARQHRDRRAAGCSLDHQRGCQGPGAGGRGRGPGRDRPGPGRAARHRRRSCRPVNPRGEPEGRGGGRRRRAAGRCRSRPGRARRPVDHRRRPEGAGAGRRGQGAGRYRPRPGRTARRRRRTPGRVDHQAERQGIGAGRGGRRADPYRFRPGRAGRAVDR